MTRAAFEKVVDFSKAKPLDVKWLLFLRAAIDFVEEKSFLELSGLVYQRLLMLLLVSAIVSNDKEFSKTWTKSSDIIRDFYRVLFPWRKDAEENKRSRVESKKKELNRLTKMWKKVFGAENSDQDKKEVKPDVPSNDGPSS